MTHKPFKIRANGEIFNRVSRPACVFDRENGALLKIGEFDEMKQYFHNTTAVYRSHGFNEIASDIVFMELPKDQDEIDKVFQITGYVTRLYNTLVGQSV